MKKFSFCLMLSVILVLIFSLYMPVYSQEPASSLYQRLGNVNGISAVVDDFVDNLLKNEVVTKNEKVVAALGRITKPGLKFQLTAFICQATGGPEKYTGRSMKDSHSHLGINEAEWQATVSELTKSLAKFTVPKQEQDELIAIVATTKSDIVTLAAPIADKAPPVEEIKEVQVAPPPEPEPGLVPPVNAAPESTIKINLDEE